MFVFYLICAIFGGLALAAALIILFVFEIKIGKRCFNKKGKTIPVEEFLPHSVYSMLFWLTNFGLCGIFFEKLGIGWYLNIIFAMSYGFIVNFIIVHFIKPFIMDIVYGKLPNGDDISGMEGVCIDSISGDGYGKIEVSVGGNGHILNAISANATDIDEGEQVTIITQEEGVCFVQKSSEIYDALKENDSHVYF